MTFAYQGVEALPIRYAITGRFRNTIVKPVQAKTTKITMTWEALPTFHRCCSLVIQLMRER